MTVKIVKSAEFGTVKPSDMRDGCAYQNSDGVIVIGNRIGDGCDTIAAFSIMGDFVIRTNSEGLFREITLNVFVS